jgi:hypothetical protein
MKEATNQPARYLTPPEIACRMRVAYGKVMGWIRRAELRAINVSDGYRPRYRIRPDDFELFLKSREVQPPPPIVRRRRQMPPEGGPLDPKIGKELAKRGEAVLVLGTYFRLWNDVILFF